MNERNHCALLLFISRASRQSGIASLPTNSMSRMRTCGPSSTWKVRFTSFGPPPIGLISGVTMANWYPFSASISRTVVVTRLIRPGSRNESSRMTELFSFSFSSIFVCSTFFDPTYSTILTRWRSSML